MRKPFIALVSLAVVALAHAEPLVAPIADGGVWTFHEEPTKYRLFNGPTGATHAAGVMNWYYNDANRPAAVTKSAVLSQIRASMSKWSAVCKITFAYQGETTAGFSLLTSSIDGINVIGWDATGISAPTTGITQIAWNGSNTIVDSEIRLNAAYAATYTNLDATVTHEVGHSIGIDHSDVSGQVMSGPPLTTYTGFTTLRSDDVAACVKLYGAAGSSPPPPDTQAPTVPTGLTATAVSTNTVNLAWNASSDDVGVASYKVFMGGTLLGTAPGTAASVNGLSPGSTYSFTVSACDAAANCSAPSAPASATTLSGDSQAPSVPTGLTATAAGTSQVNLAWNASSDNVGIANYQVFMGGTQTGTVGGTTASLTGLAPATTYTFTVSACDAAGNCSAQSAAASATTAAASPPPTCTGTKPPDEQQVIACPAGQTGAIVQSRSYSCVGTTWTPGVFQTISNTCTVSPVHDVQDMWWAGSSENGWGLTITQHADKLFLAWYLYDASGNPLWIVMSSGQWNAAHTAYTGDLYIPTGSSFANYDVSRFAPGTPVGTATLTFTSSSTATLAYTVRGVGGSKAISRLPFGVVDTTPIASYGDMWWGGSAQDGWGLVISQQYRNLFATWFTYDASGQVTWFVMSDGTWSGNTYSGALYRTHGTPVVGAPYDASSLVVTRVGTLTLTFSDADNATMTYTVDSVTQTKPIVRLPF